MNYMFFVLFHFKYDISFILSFEVNYFYFYILKFIQNKNFNYKVINTFIE